MVGLYFNTWQPASNILECIIQPSVLTLEQAWRQRGRWAQGALGLVVRSRGCRAGRMRLRDSVSQSALPSAIQEREQPLAYLDEEVW